jgi:hypothetical protein
MSRSLRLIAAAVMTVAALVVGAQGGTVSPTAGPSDGWCC